jgi:hypothetical protein
VLKLVPSVESDLPEIGVWIAEDPWHSKMGDDFWLTGSDCFLAAKAVDAMGTVAYTRIEEEENRYRLHTQFAPEYVVSKRRVAAATIEFLQVISDLAKANGKQCLITESRSPSLIAFLKRVGWKETEPEDNFLLEV